MSKKAERRERIQLRTKPRGSDLDGYLFTDLKHACTWLKQGLGGAMPASRDLRFSIALVIAYETIAGEDRVEKVLRRMKVSEFLKEFDK